MFEPTRGLPRLLVPIFVVVAIIGYLAGHGRSHRASAERMLTASAASVLLEYPSRWQPASAAPAIPGLSISHSIVLAPGGDPMHAGLVAGQLLGGEPSALPLPFTALLRKLPDTEVVDLLGNQAYRYARLSVPGFAPELTLYTIPSPGGNATALACYAASGFAAEMRTCEQIVSTLTLVGQSQSYDLTPSASYARQLTASIGRLDQQRLALRAEMGTHATFGTIQRAASRLASLFAAAAESLSALEPSLAAGRAQATLAASLLAARDAYTAFANAAGIGGPTALAAARKQVEQAETAVDSALEGFALLGYKQT
jgi:hypothetical protein